VSIGFAVIVPAAVVTCGGRAIGEQGGVGGDDGSDVVFVPGTTATATATTTAPSVPTVFPTADETSYVPDNGDFSPVVFLGAYQEPDWPALGVPIPAASSTATVPSPCAERTEMCNARVPREQWAQSLVLACKSELGNCGNVQLVFPELQACVRYAVVYGNAWPAYARCIATLAYHTSCSSGSSAASYITTTSCPM
jgi:hypothetical protein